MNAIIIHGSYGSPEENWIPWLKGELEKREYRIFIPRFPTPDGQNLESWNAVFKEFEKYLGKETILVGHSLGVAFVLSVLERIKNPIKASFLIAGFIGKLNNEKFDEKNRTFIEREFDWEKIRANCGRFFLFHSDNDPNVPIEKAKELASMLSVEPIIVKNAGHFNSSSGYGEFPLLLEKILEN